MFKYLGKKKKKNSSRSLHTVFNISQTMYSRSFQRRTRILFRSTIQLQHRTYLNGPNLSCNLAVRSPTITAPQNPQPTSKIWNFLSKRYYGAPGSGYQELGDPDSDAFKEKRFYRYYKFSDKLDG